MSGTGSMSGTGTDPGAKSSGEIETEVERTRANVSDTLDALRGKMAPSQLMDQMVDRVTDYARGSGGAEFARNLGASVRANPLPVALIGAGIAWLLLSKNDSAGGVSGGPAAPSAHAPVPRLLPAPGGDSSGGMAASAAGMAGTARARVSGAMETVQDRAGQMAGAAGDAVSRAGSAVGDAASRVAAAGSDLVDSASDSAGRAVQGLGAFGQQAVGAVGEGLGSARSGAASASRGLGQLTEAQPLLFGALGLALGAALGAVLPRTRAEDQLMGETRDTVADRVGEAAREGYENVRSAAGEHLDHVQEAVATTYSETKQRLDQEGISSAGDVLGKAAGDVTRAAGEALRGVAEEARRTVEGGEPKQG
jgi:ElaB/YqjD/DUF883 family membrane-anchored ribosome-binding protein